MKKKRKSPNSKSTEPKQDDTSAWQGSENPETASGGHQPIPGAGMPQGWGGGLAFPGA